MAFYDTTVVIFKINKKSHRGFYFKESTVEDYLNSDAYRNRVKNNSALGIVTHLNRKKEATEETETKKIPNEDQLLLKRLPVSILQDLFIEDGYLKGHLRILDPDLFEGEVRERLLFIQGLLKSGVKLTTSAGIEAFYNPITKEGEKIYDIVGVDFTLSPDFEDAKVEE